MEETICEKAVRILQNTKDGNDLDPRDLSLIQYAVNKGLNEKGLLLFSNLYEQVVNREDYKKPPFHGVEHLSIDNEGYVYWKNIQLEHYNHPFSQDAAAHAAELGRCCRYLEHIGLSVNMTNVIWNWDKIKTEHPGYETFGLA